MTNKEQWYNTRNKRTNSFLTPGKDLKGFKIGVVVESEDLRIKILTELTVNMLARWCNNIVLDGCQKVDLNDLKVKIIDIDPYSNVELSSVSEIDTNLNILIATGKNVESNKPFVYADAMGWDAFCGLNEVGNLSKCNWDNDIIGISFAACLANAEAFRVFNFGTNKPYSRWYSLMSRKCESTQPPKVEGLKSKIENLGNIQIIGCGSIGSSFVHLFPYSGYKANFTLIDPDSVEDQNTSSSLLFNSFHSKDNILKTEVCEKYLMSNGIACKSTNEYYNQRVENLDILLCFANEQNIWAKIQHNYPPISFHATTSNDWGVNIARHIPLKDECLACSFKNILKTEFVPNCSEVVMPTNEKDEEMHTAILPFLAPAAAVITLAEMLKAVNGIVSKEGTTIFNMSTIEAEFIEDMTAFGKCSICTNQETIYSIVGNQSKYWTLSIK